MLDTFVISLNEQDLNDKTVMESFQKLMDSYADELVAYIHQIADDLDITLECATDVVYLRSRSRWTQELEKELIILYDIGEPPNMCDFG